MTAVVNKTEKRLREGTKYCLISFRLAAIYVIFISVIVSLWLLIPDKDIGWLFGAIGISVILSLLGIPAYFVVLVSGVPGISICLFTRNKTTKITRRVWLAFLAIIGIVIVPGVLLSLIAVMLNY